MIGLNKGFLQYDVIKKCQTSGLTLTAPRPTFFLIKEKKDG